MIRLPRHGASLPIGIGVSCSADRQALGKITKDGVFLEQLETNPSRFLPELQEDENSDVVRIDLNKGMESVLEELNKHPVRTRLSLSGPLIVARDLAHSRLRERLNSGIALPETGRSSRYLALANFTVFKFDSAEVPPITTAK